MPTRFHDKHRRAKRASRRLQLAFWLSLLLAHLGYTSVFFLPLIGLVTLGKSPHPIIASGGFIGFLAMPVIISLVAALYPTSRILTAYRTMRCALDAMTVDEQAASLGATPARPNNDPAERRYTNLIAELSLAADIDEPDAYVLRDDHSINAFALSDTNGDLALAVSQGALNNLSRDELQAILAHEFGHIENGDPTLYNRLTAMLSCYYSNGGSLQLCRHGDTLRRLARPCRQSLHNSLTNYYRQKPQLTLKQAHLRFALEYLLMPQALPAGE